MIRIVHTIFMLFAFVFVATSPASAKLAPPPELNTVQQQLEELEEAFEEGHWSEVDEQLEKFENVFAATSKAVVKAGGKDPGPDFEFVLKAFRKSASQKDRKKVSNNFIAIQRLFFDSMDHFEYKVHPIVNFMEAYLDEAQEGVEKSDWERAKHELNEVGSFFKRAKTMFKSRGVSDAELAEFETVHTSTLEAVNKTSKALTEAGIQKLSDLLKGMKKRLG